MENEPTERRTAEAGQLREAILKAVEEQGRVLVSFPDGTTYRVGQFIGVVSCVQAYDSEGKREEAKDVTYDSNRVIVHGPFTSADKASAANAVVEALINSEEGGE